MVIKLETEAAYHDWLTNQPDGFVVNFNKRRWKTSHYMVHRVRCRLMDPERYQRSESDAPMTGGAYGKLGADDFEDAWTYGMTNGFRQEWMRPCRACLHAHSAPIRPDDRAHPEEAGATDPPARQATASLGNRVPVQRQESRTVFERSPAVVSSVLASAHGSCEMCREPAPFVDDAGRPFLEVHHVLRLADGGPDTIDNAIAVCPNCHRRLHHGADRADCVEDLYARIARLRRPAKAGGE